MFGWNPYKSIVSDVQTLDEIKQDFEDFKRPDIILFVKEFNLRDLLVLQDDRHRYLNKIQDLRYLRNIDEEVLFQSYKNILPKTQKLP